MTRASRANVIRWGALAVGIVLFVGALYYINLSMAVGTIRRLGVALPLALFFSGLWHLARTWAWAQCFPQPRNVSFLRLARVRLAAEAFSYLTLRGIAGEPLKVVLLNDRVDTREATAAVALERMAYMIVTALIVGIGSVLAILMLPLTRLWFRVFRAFALTAAIVAVLAGLVVSGRGVYMQALLLRMDRWFGTSIASGRISRFVTAVERQMLDLVRGNPRRLAVLVASTVAAYVFMALEAWVILRASGTPVSAIGAMTVETFSRVASFASAFIPANLGALEASSLAAVAAIGVAGGGAALALARRIRGLFWAGIGLAIYPRGAQRPAPADAETAVAGGELSTPQVLLYIPRDPGVKVSPTVRFAGMGLGERILRSALRAGYSRVIVWEPEGSAGASPRLFTRLAREIGRSTIARTPETLRSALSEFAIDGHVTVVGAGTLVSPALLRDAAEMATDAGCVRDVSAGDDWPVSGVIRMRSDAAGDAAFVSKALAARRAEAWRPNGDDVSSGRARLAIRVVDTDDIARAEHHLRRSSYKDTDATVARFNRRISLPISIALIPTPLTANQLSVILVAIGFYSGWLFSFGSYWAGVGAAFLSLAASVLDGCDGEIARLKYQESALGCWIETVGDYSYYIAIFIGMTFGAVHQTGWGLFYWIGMAAIGGTLLTFALLIYLRTRITAGQPTRLHAVARERFNTDASLWTRITWNLAFVATRAAMPYGIMVLAFLYALPLVIVLAAIGSNLYWVTLVIKLRDLLREEETVAA
ncbi:MAG: flippase-like domain-containing protein [Acidobacteria bacterium]|nr:flippase-like domain-containing protein [Acidobacteriota bacterium]